MANDPAVSLPTGVDPKRASSYAKTIAQAKAKTKERPAPLQGAPAFDSLPKGDQGPPPNVTPRETLSPQTVSGLQAVARAQEGTQQGAEAADLQKEEEASIANEPVLEPSSPEAQFKRMRAAVEARLDPVDIGGYFTAGHVIQNVPIIPGQLEVKFRTVTDLEETHVDHALVKEGELSTREFLRRSNEWALATHIESLNGVRWPPPLDGNGTISEKAMELRMANVRKLPSPLFNLLATNLDWFLKRVNDAMTIEVLGNG